MTPGWIFGRFPVKVIIDYQVRPGRASSETDRSGFALFYSMSVEMFE